MTDVKNMGDNYGCYNYNNSEYLIFSSSLSQIEGANSLGLSLETEMVIEVVCAYLEDFRDNYCLKVSARTGCNSTHL